MRTTAMLAILLLGLAWAAAGRGQGLALTEVWRIDRHQDAPSGVAITAGPVAYAPAPGQPPRLYVMAMEERLAAYDPDGGEVWSVALGGRPQQTIAVADLNRDGRSELVLALDDAVVCVREGGEVAWRHALDASPAGPAVGADVMGDEALEVLVADGEGGLTCLDARGRVLWHLLAENAHRPVDQDPFVSRLNWNYERYRNRDATAPPTVGDVDGDGAAEILFATEPGYLYCLSGRGEWKWQFGAGGMIFGAPLIADLDRDGRPEVIFGSEDQHLYVLDGATGRLRAAIPTEWGIGPNLAVADLDGNGITEVIFGDDRGYLYCWEPPDRLRWRVALKADPPLTSEWGDRFAAPPAIADVDGDGRLNLVVGMVGREHLYLLDADGAIKATHLLEAGPTAKMLAESGVWATPIVADLAGDRQLEIIVATRLFSLVALQAGAKGDAAIAWQGARGDAALTGCALPQPGGATNTEVKRERVAAEAAIGLDQAAESLVQGRIDADLRRPPDAPAVLLTTIRTASGATELRIDQVLSARERFGIAAPADADWPANVRCQLVRADDGALLAEHGARISLSAAAARARVHEQALAAAADAIQGLRLDWPNAQALAAARAAALGTYTDPPLSPAHWAQRNVVVAEHLRALPGLAQRRHRDHGPLYLLTWSADPWDAFTPGAWPAAEVTVPATLEVWLYQGEYEAAAANLLNLGALPLGVRVAVSDLTAENGATLEAARYVEIRRTRMVPRHAGDMVGDALVRLDEASVLTVAPMQAAQLWVTVSGVDAAPGAYTGAITLTETTPQNRTATIPLQVHVWPIAMPRESPVRFCTWAYLENSPLRDHIEAALADLVAHRNDVFTLNATVAVTYNSAGELIQAEWSALEPLVRRYAGHGILLLPEPGLRFAGAGAPPPEAERKAFPKAMALLAQYLADNGVGYDRWAVYVVDEPGLDHGPRIEYLIERAQRIKAADPRIRIYANPVAPMSLEDLQRAAPYVDIWCPEQDSLYRLWGPTADMHPQEKLAFYRAHSAEVWTYECFPRAKRMSPLGYYRHQAWLAWTLGLNGLGFWTYCTDPNDQWLPNRDEYALVYAGADGPIPSKRWEACRDGVEDYIALFLARQAAEEAAARGDARAPAAAAEIETLARGVVERRAVLGALQGARRRLAELTLALSPPPRVED